jgi:hypothetical protein
VTGKPDPAMHAECVRRTGARRPLVVGDRLDTDIEGAHRAGAPSLLVLTGVTDPATLLAAVPQHRPDLLAADAGGLLVAHPPVSPTDGGWRCGGWSVHASGGRLRLTGGDAHDSADDDLDGLRALCVAHWAGGPAGGDVPAVEGTDDRARAALDRWRLGS